MFASKKQKTDAAGTALLRFLDLRREPCSRFKYLAGTFSNLPAESMERRRLFENHAFEIFHLFTELMCHVEFNVAAAPAGLSAASNSVSASSISGSTAVLSSGTCTRSINELEYALWLLEQLICHIPEHFTCGWQQEAILSAMKRFIHPHNTIGLRRIGIRLFVLWYQITDDSQVCSAIFECIVPYLVAENTEDGSTSNSNMKLLEICEGSCKMYGLQQKVPFRTRLVTPLAHCSIHDSLDDASKCLLVQTYLEKLLESISIECTKIQWVDSKSTKQEKCLERLFEKIRSCFDRLFAHQPLDLNRPDSFLWDIRTRQIEYNPVDDVCIQCLARWLALYAFSNRKQTDSLNANEKTLGESREVLKTVASQVKQKSPPNMKSMRAVVFNSAKNVKFMFGIFQLSFTLPLKYAGTMGRVFKVLKEWLLLDCDLPSFFDLSTLPRHYFHDNFQVCDIKLDFQTSIRCMVAVLSSFLMSRNFQDADIVNSAIFAQITGRILSLFKSIANNSSVELKLESWLFLLETMLSVVEHCLPSEILLYENASYIASQMFQTLLVTWVLAGLNVQLPDALWNRLYEILHLRRHFTCLVVEWSKVMDSLTRTIALQIYHVDLSDLPADRLSEQKRKKLNARFQTNVKIDAPIEKAPNTFSLPVNMKTKRYERVPISATTHTTVYRTTSSKIMLIDKENELVKTTDVVSLCSNASQEGNGDSLSAKGFMTLNDESSSLIFGSTIVHDVEDNQNMVQKTSSETLEEFASVEQDDDDDEDELDLTGNQYDTTVHMLASPSLVDQMNTTFSAQTALALIWRRILGSLGDISDGQIHHQIFDLVSKLSEMLFIVRDNQGISEQQSPNRDMSPVSKPASLVPPCNIMINILIKLLQNATPSVEKKENLMLQCLFKCLARENTLSFTETTWLTILKIIEDIVNDDNVHFEVFNKSMGVRLFCPNYPNDSLIILKDYYRRLCVDGIDICKSDCIDSLYRMSGLLFDSCDIDDDFVGQIFDRLLKACIIAPDHQIFTSVTYALSIFLCQLLTTNVITPDSIVDSTLQIIDYLMNSSNAEVIEVLVCNLNCAIVDIQQGQLTTLKFRQAIFGVCLRTLQAASFDSVLTLCQSIVPSLTEWVLLSRNQGEMLILLMDTLLTIRQNFHVKKQVELIIDYAMSQLIDQMDRFSMYPCSVSSTTNIRQCFKLANSKLITIQDDQNITMRQAFYRTNVIMNRLSTDLKHNNSVVNELLVDNSDIYRLKYLDSKKTNENEYVVSNRLPSFAECDMNNLDRLMNFLQSTSPECFTINYIENNEEDYSKLVSPDFQSSFKEFQLHNSELYQNPLVYTSQSQDKNYYNEIFDSMLNFLDASRQKVKRSYLKEASSDTIDEGLLRELKHLDHVSCKETHKIAVIYVPEGSFDKQSILSIDEPASAEFEQFVAALGWEVRLKDHRYYVGGLPNNDINVTAPYWCTASTEILFHVNTRLLGSESDWTKKLRHIGNDEVHIVWTEHWTDYRRSIIPTDFCDLLLCITPLAANLFRVRVETSTDSLAACGPLKADACTVRGLAALVKLVRRTALNASRTKRFIGGTTHHQHRSQTLENLCQRLKPCSQFSDLVEHLLFA